MGSGRRAADWPWHACRVAARDVINKCIPAAVTSQLAARALRALRAAAAMVLLLLYTRMCGDAKERDGRSIRPRRVLGLERAGPRGMRGEDESARSAA